MCTFVANLRSYLISSSFFYYLAGALATLGALTFGLVQFKRGNMAKSQLAMRMRVLAQGGTVVALLLGALFAASGTNSRKFQTKT